MQTLGFKDLTKEEQVVLLKVKEAADHYHNPKGTHFVGAALQTSDGQIFQGAAIRRF